MTEVRLTRGMKILGSIVILQALSVAVTLIFFPTRTETLFFWKISPPINAILLGVLYTSTVIFVGQALWRGRWETMRYLAFASIWGAFAVGRLWFARERDWNRLYPVADMLVVMAGLWLVAILFQGASQPASLGPWFMAGGLVAVMLAGLSLRWLQSQPTVTAVRFPNVGKN